MRHFNFETNIQERMPQTSKVFFVKRMTADYAECYPFDVDGFIEDIYQKYQQVAADDPRLAAWAKTREELRRQWVKTLSVTRPSGDATIYPNRDGRQEPALMEVWQKAGDYWARGLRIGDTLPKIVPPCRITRLKEGGWVALFPNEMHLLECRPETTEATEAALAFDEPQTDDESTLPKIDGGDGMEREASEAEEAARDEERRKIFAAVGAVAVTAVMIYFFGLLGPAVFGLLCGGLLKG